jgi:hypothetical protein
MRSPLLSTFLIAIFAAPALAQKQPEFPRAANLAPEFQKLDLPARAQGSRDDCSLFAITGAVNFELARNDPNAPRPLSEEFLIWAGDEATGTKGDQAMFYKAVLGLNVHGICANSLMPYQAKPNPNRKPSPEAAKEAKALAQRWDVHWIKRWDVTQRLTDAQIHAIKQAIAAGHPVASGLRWPNKGDDLVDVPPADKVSDGHSILLVGYEDDASKPGGGVFVFRNSWGPKWGNNGYSTMSYGYARSYANDALWLHLGAPRSEIPTVRYEAELLPVTASGKATATPQDMADFGTSMWSNGKQLMCQAEVGGFIDLTFNVKQAGKYRVRVLGTAAPDFGIIRASMGGKAAGSFDLYSGRVCPSGSLELGTHELAAGKHAIRFTVTGKNPGSKGHSFGLDTVDLFVDK